LDTYLDNELAGVVFRHGNAANQLESSGYTKKDKASIAGKRRFNRTQGFSSALFCFSLIILLPAGLRCENPSTSADVVASTEEGKLLGRRLPDASVVFQNIPFAQPPVANFALARTAASHALEWRA